ncbi:uncharacterized protein LOC120841693 [Ixodes scapularis]|uniref:uncharacterized protein LOC120841693 n=1 Tax=Ixodes scapularis TaxID=6945 RepID=UPI001A9D3736|nr:uncharacterized protein LOC120841693 [Ixodes scapularis]
MLLSGKYLVVILVSAIILHHVAGRPAAMSEVKDIETSKDSVDYAKQRGLGANYAKQRGLGANYAKQRGLGVNYSKKTA